MKQDYSARTRFLNFWDFFLHLLYSRKIISSPGKKKFNKRVFLKKSDDHFWFLRFHFLRILEYNFGCKFTTWSHAISAISRCLRNSKSFSSHVTPISDSLKLDPYYDLVHINVSILSDAWVLFSSKARYKICLHIQWLS